MYKILDNPEKSFVKCPQNLTKKVHVPKASRGRCFFTFGKLGESMWKDTLASFKMTDFAFFDPQNHECPVEYNPLFDPHLNEFFRRKNILNHLQKNHLVTDRNEIVCSIGDFNHYRKCMHRLKAEGNFDKQRRSNYLEAARVENENFMKLYPAHKEKSSSFNNPLKFENVLKCINERKLNREIQRHQKFTEIVKNYGKRLERISQLDCLKRSKMMERGFYRDIEITKKRMFVLEKQRDRRAKIQKKIYEREKPLEKQENFEPNVNYIIRCPIKI